MKRKCPKCNRTLAIAGSGSFYDSKYELTDKKQAVVLYCLHCINEDRKQKMKEVKGV